MLMIARSGGKFTIGGAAPAFSPMSLSPRLFFDFSDKSTLFQDSAGLVPVTSNNDDVKLIRDKSGFGFDATLAIAAKYKTDGVLGWLETNGYNNLLKFSKNVIDVTTSNTVITSLQLLAAGNYPQVFNADSGDKGLFILFNGTTRKIRFGVRTTAGLVYGTATSATPLATSVSFENEWNRPALTVTGRDKDGTVVVSAGTGVDADLQTPINNYAMAGAANYLNGKYFTLVAVPRLLTASEKADLRAYVNGKAGI